MSPQTAAAAAILVICVAAWPLALIEPIRMIGGSALHLFLLTEH